MTRLDCIDPCWNVELLNRPADLHEGFKASWMFGTSYHLNGNVEPFKGKILEPGFHARCPKDTSHQTFKTVATVMQDWIVDQNGEFVNVVDEDRCIETVHGPDKGNEWCCATCGETADVIEVGA